MGNYGINKDYKRVKIKDAWNFKWKITRLVNWTYFNYRHTKQGQTGIKLLGYTQAWTEKKNELVSAIYAFWWIGDSSELNDSSKLYLEVKLKGKKINKTDKEFLKNNSNRIDLNGHIIHTIKWNNDWFNTELPCLYIGKTTNLVSRIGQHLMLKKKEWVYNNGFLYKHNSSCQFRSGFEHLFQNFQNRKDIMLNKVGITFQSFNWNDVADRFYLEDLAIGYLRPWFNIDSER